MKRNVEFKIGDVIGFSGRELQSACINLGTYGIPFRGISHVGIVAGRWSWTGTPERYPYDTLLSYESKVDKDLPLFESTIKNGTHTCPLLSRIEMYPGRVWHYPLYRKLYIHEQKRLWDFLTVSIGRPYDAMGAFRSGGIGLSWIESCFRKEDLSAIFCSEWLAAAFATTGLYPIVNASRWNPNRLCRRLRRGRVLKKPVRIK